jgi:glutamate-1-semialdehyde 2,1-aminomutase
LPHPAYFLNGWTVTDRRRLLVSARSLWWISRLVTFERKPRSDYEASLLDKGRRTMPSGPRNPTRSPEQAIIVRRAHGVRIEDCSGNEYIDYLLGSGPMLLGHAHPAVVAAVRDALADGSAYLLAGEACIELAERMVEAVPCADKVYFQSTGTEATFFALRLARAYRKRDKILKFEGAYHGMHDYALVSTQWTVTPAAYPTPVANSAGIPASVLGEVLVAPFNDIDTTARIIEQYADELAAVIVEPMQRTIPPRAGFLPDLREITLRLGIPLIFDEVVTGFRLAYGGAQEYYGVVPDLCALGKSVSGGHPIGVLCGRDEIMDCAGPAKLMRGEGVLLSGTYSGNPISTAAALAAMRELRRPGVYEELFARGRRLMRALADIAGECGIPAVVSGEPPAFELWFTDGDLVNFRDTLRADSARQGRFAQLLMDRGVIKAHEKFFVSTAHTDADIDTTIEAAREAMQQLATELHFSRKPKEGSAPPGR